MRDAVYNTIFQIKWSQKVRAKLEGRSMLLEFVPYSQFSFDPKIFCFRTAILAQK
jgi:hypothetical protein